MLVSIWCLSRIIFESDFDYVLSNPHQNVLKIAWEMSQKTGNGFEDWQRYP